MRRERISAYAVSLLALPAVDTNVVIVVDDVVCVEAEEAAEGVDSL